MTNIYLDNNSTTPLHPDVKAAMIAAMEIFGNPSSLYSAGTTVRKMVEHARCSAAKLIHATPAEIIFTSCGSESNNTILNPVALNHLFATSGRNEVIVSAIEHPSVINAARNLERNGIKVHYAPVDSYGRIIWERFTSMLSGRTAIVSIMLANNEIGTIQDIKVIAEAAHKVGAYVHTDAVQAVGKMEVDVLNLGIDYLSYSAHKIYGPKGVGVLYVRTGAPYATFMYGGHQETGRRSGTENVCGIIGLGKAAEITNENMDEWCKNNLQLRDMLIEGLKKIVPDIRINGDLSRALPHVVNASFTGIPGEAMLIYLDQAGIAVSTGSACSSGLPSYVLRETGLEPKLANSSIRFSLGYHNTEEQIEYTLSQLRRITHLLKT